MAAIRAYVNTLKSGQCSKCGGRFHPVSMDWHHRSPNEKYKEVSKMVALGRSLVRVLEEIEKCDLICSNCHRVLTHFGDCS